MEPFEVIEPEQFVAKRNNNELSDAMVIDVREPGEWAYYHLDETVLIPMNSIPSKLEELPRDQTLYIICAHGVRSANVCYYLRQQGYEDVVNVEGGMAAVAMLQGFQYD